MAFGLQTREAMMKRLFYRHFPLTMLCLAFAWSCSDEDDDSPQAAVGAVTGSGGSGGSAATRSSAGSGGSIASGTGAASSGEMGGSNGLAPAGMNSNASGAAQGGSAGAAITAGAGGGAGAASEATGGAPDAGPALVSYAKDIQPILQENCSPCHAGDDDGGHNAATSYADAVRVSADIVREIRSGGMPESGEGNLGCDGGDPGDPGCVSAADFALIQRWIADGTQR